MERIAGGTPGQSDKTVSAHFRQSALRRRPCGFTLLNGALGWMLRCVGPPRGDVVGRSSLSVPALFASWYEARPTLRPSTKLAEAIGYALNRRAELTRFLDDGRIALDTGHLERSLRPVAIGRKNYLFYGSLRG